VRIEKVEAIYELVAVALDGDLQPSTMLSTGKVTCPGKKTIRRIERDSQGAGGTRRTARTGT